MSKDNFEEIECKFLDVDSELVIKKLTELGAEFEFKKLFRRYVFDFPDLRLNAQKSWLRVRDEGHRTTISFKQRIGVNDGQNDEGMKEIEISTDDFDKSAELFKAIGMTPKFYEENWRTQYKLDGVEITIDEWPLIPPYVEIEADDWPKVDAMAVKLGFNPENKIIFSTAQVYDKYGITEADYSELTFEKQTKK